MNDVQWFTVASLRRTVDVFSQFVERTRERERVRDGRPRATRRDRLVSFKVRHDRCCAFLRRTDECEQLVQLNERLADELAEQIDVLKQELERTGRDAQAKKSQLAKVGRSPFGIVRVRRATGDVSRRWTIAATRNGWCRRWAWR
jgi:hypothetical protein